VQVVLLAAGLGSRLGDLTRDIPKALISVGGRTLLEHCLLFAAQLEPDDIVIVGGYGFDQVATVLAEIKKRVVLPPIQLVENRNFRQGNILSLQTARPHIEQDFLLMNVDHIFRAAIANVVRPAATRVTGFIDTDRQLGADDMKVARTPNGAISRIAKTLETFDCGYVGMTLVPRQAQQTYFATLDAARAEEGDTIHIERILARLAEGPTPPVVRDISGHGWLEIDTPEERARAEEQLRDGPWL
jgi:L-glutamine-phosphate cytidylyltransferase